MTRYLTTITVAAIACFWAGAQDPRKPRSEEQARLFERNRAMIEKLVDGSLMLAKTRNALDRTKAYETVLGEMKTEIAKASEGKDQARMRELAGHLGTVLMQGFVPNLENARKAIAPGSEAEGQLYKVRDQAGRTVGSVLDSMPDDPIVKAKIQEAKTRVDAVK